jgi:hypothetical protein
MKGRDCTLPCVVIVVFVDVVGHWGHVVCRVGRDWVVEGCGGSGPGLTRVRTQGPVQPATEPEPAKTGPVRRQLALDLKF